jgi:drug/metabolite transporter (DMT)-like permease
VHAWHAKAALVRAAIGPQNAAMTRTTILAAFLLTVSSLAWAGNIVLARAVHADIPPVGLSFWRWTVALLLLLAFTFPVLRDNWPVIRREWRRLFLLALFGMTIFHTSLYVALNHTTAVNVALIMAAVPVLVPVLSWALYREPVAPRLVLGAAISLIGVGIIITRADPTVVFGLRFNGGDLLAMLAMAAWSLYTVLVKRRPPDLHPQSLLTGTIACAVVAILPLYGLETLFVRPMPISGQALAVVGYVSLVASLLAFLCFNRGIELMGPNRGGLFIHLVPVFATFLAILFLGERLQLFHAVGVAAIALGLVIAAMAPARSGGLRGA